MLDRCPSSALLRAFQYHLERARRTQPMSRDPAGIQAISTACTADQPGNRTERTAPFACGYGQLLSHKDAPFDVTPFLRVLSRRAGIHLQSGATQSGAAAGTPYRTVASHNSRGGSTACPGQRDARNAAASFPGPDLARQPPDQCTDSGHSSRFIASERPRGTRSLNTSDFGNHR